MTIACYEEQTKIAWNITVMPLSKVEKERGQGVRRHLAAGCSRPLCFGSRDVTGSDMIN